MKRLLLLISLEILFLNAFSQNKQPNKTRDAKTTHTKNVKSKKIRNTENVQHAIIHKTPNQRATDSLNEVNIKLKNKLK
jgi:hypothetical protein